MDYYYDPLNRLDSVVWTDPDLLQYYYRYYYDNGGNLISKQLLLCGEEDWDVVDEDIYVYASTGWKDLLVEFNGETITYDAIGNPLSYYGGRSFTWEGRELKTLTNGDTTASYVYNESGIRTSKTVDGVTTSYLLEGSRIIFQTVGSTRWSFLYYGDELTGFEVEGETYYYLKNLQGDILQIVDEDGEIVVEYLYDDWGKLLSIEGELSDTLGEENPFRYRGYYYDSESGLYYLNSRYYDPETGRWISAEPKMSDGACDISSGLLAYNAYIYCANNPINCSDPTGEFILTALIIGAIVGAAIGFGITAFADYSDDGQVFNGSIDAKSYVANTLVGGVVGGITGGVGSSTLSLTLPTLQVALTTTGSAVLVGGTATVTIAGTKIVAGAVVVGHILLSRTLKSGGYYGERWPGDPHKPDHVHLRGNNTDIRIGRDGNPLPGEDKLTPKARKALDRLWDEFVELFEKW